MLQFKKSAPFNIFSHDFSRSICLAAPVKAQLFNAVEILQQDDVVTVPGEIYPETDLRLITINCNDLKLLSKELCCGTHASNTQQLEQFCITNLKQTNRARYAFTAVAGEAAKRVCILPYISLVNTFFIQGEK